MLHTHTHTVELFPTIKKTRTDLVLVAILLLLLAMAVWAMRPTSSPALVINPIPVQQGSGSSSMAADRTQDLSNVEHKTQALAAPDSTEAFQTLLLSLKESEPFEQRAGVLTALQSASPAVVPFLMTALTDADPWVRAGAAEALGLRREYQAIAALTTATYDINDEVRLQAVRSLGAIDAWQVLPRMEQLQVDEPNYDVRQAAAGAQEDIRSNMAQAIGVSTSQLRAISVTPTDSPQIYAATASDLYARHGTRWELVSRLPDAPLALATSAEPQLIYLATVSSGLYRSLDSGQTWEHVQFGLRTPTQLTVTAIVVDPQNSRRMFIALAAQGANPGAKDALGIFASQDDGATFIFLPDGPTSAITTRLVVDSQSEEYLFGMIEDTPWRYTLPLDEPDSQ